MTSSLLVNRDDAKPESFINELSNSQVKVIGPELVSGKIYNADGFNKVENDLFRYLVIIRLFHPGSKLKAIGFDIFEGNIFEGYSLLPAIV